MTVAAACACAWCRRVRTTEGDWVSTELEDLDSPETTHGICPSCLEREIRGILAAGTPEAAARSGEAGSAA